MSKYLSDEHYIFSPENPLYDSKFGEHHPSIQDVLKFLSKNGETAEMVHGKYDGKSSKFIMVHYPKNIDGLHQLASDLGQESAVYSKNGKHQFHFYNGPKRGEIKKGSGTIFSKEEPKEDHVFIHTDQGPMYFSHNIEDLKRSEKSPEEALKEKLEKLNNLKTVLESKKNSFVYIPDHLVIKNACSHWR